MPSGYRYAGAHIAAARSQFDVQHQDMGVLELNIDQLVPTGKERLILALQSFTVPGRDVGVGELPYLNGNARYPTRPNPLGNISATFRDFPEQGSRGVLHELFRHTYDESTGFMQPPSLLKFNGFLVLFQTNGTRERTALLEGMWLTKEPEIAIDFSNGEASLMEVEFSVDRVLWGPSLGSPRNP